MGNSGKASFDEEAACRPIDGAVAGGVEGHLIPPDELLFCDALFQ